MASVTQSMVVTIKIEYLLFLPHGRIWLFSELMEGASPVDKTAYLYTSDTVRIPIDLITAARLRLIRPGDDSGIGEEQWAWLRLIGLT